MDKPIINSFSTIAPLIIQEYERYLPTAFDESMSLLQKMNKIIKTLADIGALSNSVVEQWNTVMEWVMNDGLTADVSAKLDAMATDGTLDTLISTQILGNLSLLNTNDKTTIVNAVNEVLAQKPYITLEQFGAKDGQDATTAFQAMVDYSKDNKHIAMRISRKQWIISTPITVYGNEVFEGLGSIDGYELNPHIKYTGTGYMFNMTSNLLGINMDGLIIHGNVVNGSYSNSFAKWASQRSIVKNCSFLYFDRVFYLYPNGANVVENIFKNCLFSDINIAIEVYGNNSLGYSYSDGIIDGCFIASYKIAGIKGWLLEWKIVNNQIYSSATGSEGNIVFGGYLNYIVTNNFGGQDKGIVYDVVTWATNLTNNIISNNQFTANSNTYHAIELKGSTSTVINLIISNCVFLYLSSTGAIFVYTVNDGYYNVTVSDCVNVDRTKISGDVVTAYKQISLFYLVADSAHVGSTHRGNSVLKLFGQLGLYITSDTTTQREIGSLILDPQNGGLYASYGQFGNHRLVEQAVSNVGSVKLTTTNYLRYVTTLSPGTVYTPADLIMETSTGKLYVSKGANGNFEVQLSGTAI
jgi:hypothetical protein